MAAALLYAFILVAGVLQALVNPWLAAVVSFLPVVSVFAVVFLVRPTPRPKREDIAGVRWWMPLAGITGAVAVFAGLLFVDQSLSRSCERAIDLAEKWTPVLRQDIRHRKD